MILSSSNSSNSSTRNRCTYGTVVVVVLVFWFVFLRQVACFPFPMLPMNLLLFPSSCGRTVATFWGWLHLTIIVVSLFFQLRCWSCLIFFFLSSSRVLCTCCLRLCLCCVGLVIWDTCDNNQNNVFLFSSILVVSVFLLLLSRILYRCAVVDGTVPAETLTIGTVRAWIDKDVVYGERERERKRDDYVWMLMIVMIMMMMSQTRWSLLLLLLLFSTIQHYTGDVPSSYQIYWTNTTRHIKVTVLCQLNLIFAVIVIVVYSISYFVSSSFRLP